MLQIVLHILALRLLWMHPGMHVSLAKAFMPMHGTTIDLIWFDLIWLIWFDLIIWAETA